MIYHYNPNALEDAIAVLELEDAILAIRANSECLDSLLPAMRANSIAWHYLTSVTQTPDAWIQRELQQTEET